MGSGGEDAIVETVREGSRSQRALWVLGKSWDFILSVRKSMSRF